MVLRMKWSCWLLRESSVEAVNLQSDGGAVVFRRGITWPWRALPSLCPWPSWQWASSASSLQ
jgi:hypothetical protein